MRFSLRPLLKSTLYALCLVAPLAQAALNARLDRDRVAEGETVQLLLEADGQMSGSPDTGLLEKDFDVLGVASGSQVNIINGKMDARTTWSITLAPKRSGKLNIPSLAVNGERSPPLELQVTDAAISAGPATSVPIFIEAEVDRNDPYVQGMVRYTVRVFHGVDLAEGRLSEPQLDDALVRRLGEDRTYNVERGDRRYRVIERQYAMFPQTSGALHIPAPVLDARVPEQTAGRRSLSEELFRRKPFDNPFFGRSPLGGLFNSTRQIRVRGNALVLDVRPRPDRIAGSQWLPAERLELTESWQPGGGDIRVGDPITRTVTTRALGLTGEQLPDLEVASLDGFKVYPDQPAASTREVDHSIEGEKSRNIAFVPSAPGRFTLPPVRVHWWDTEADRSRLAELPARTVEVLPAAGARDVAAQPPPNVATTAEVSSSKLPPSERAFEGGFDSRASVTDNGTAAVSTARTGLWPWLSGALALLWLSTLGLLWRARLSRTERDKDADTGNGRQANARQAQARFLSACRTNDPHLARRSLLDWAAVHWPDDPPAGLEDLAEHLGDSDARQALAELDRALYCQGARSWDGSMLAKHIGTFPKRRGGQERQAPLPDLYPRVHERAT